MALAGLFSTSRKMSSFLPFFSQGPGIYCASCGRNLHIKVELQLCTKSPPKRVSAAAPASAHAVCLPAYSDHETLAVGGIAALMAGHAAAKTWQINRDGHASVCREADLGPDAGPVPAQVVPVDPRQPLAPAPHADKRVRQMPV